MNELLKSFGMFLRHNWFRIAICMPAVLCGTGAVVFAVWGGLEEQITAQLLRRGRSPIPGEELRVGLHLL